jgi:serine/threonine protein kinase
MTLRIAVQVADALDRAHRTGITHRDLKPGNIMLTKDGAKVLDFGLAKMRERAAGAISSGGSVLDTLTSPLTGEGSIVGTLQYISPEQLEGQEADALNDITADGARPVNQASHQDILIEVLLGERLLKRFRPRDGKAGQQLRLSCLTYQSWIARSIFRKAGVGSRDRRVPPGLMGP